MHNNWDALVSEVEVQRSELETLRGDSYELEATRIPQDAGGLHRLLNSADLLADDLNLPEEVQGKISDAFAAVQPFVNDVAVGETAQPEPDAAVPEKCTLGGLRNARPEWWPENPYPESVFRMTEAGYVESLPDKARRGAVSGYLRRMFWNRASNSIFEAMQSSQQEEG